MRLMAMLFLAATCGCGADGVTEEEEEPPPPDPEPCGVAEVSSPDGCVSVGVASCGEGFVSDDRGGCEAILPAEDCGPGEMAIPGEESCRPIAPCSEEPWGGIPTDGDIVYVDAAAAGSGDGSMQAPFDALPAAINAAPSHAVIAMAPGDYPVATVLAKPLRFWGRCPRDVSLSWAGGSVGAVMNVTPGASGSEFHRLAITSVADVSISASAEDLLFEEIWLHHAGLGLAGVDVALNPTILVRGSLFEQVEGIGLYAGGATITFSESVLRDMVPSGLGTGGGAVVSTQGLAKGGSSLVTIERSLIDGAFGAAIAADGSGVVVTDSVIRNVVVDQSSGADGYGAVATTGLMAPGAPGLVVGRSVIENTQTAGILGIGAALEITDTVIRDVSPVAIVGQINGEALVSEPDLQGVVGSLVARDVVLERSDVGGLLVIDSPAQIDGAIVREIRPGPEALFGDGVMVVSFMTPGSLTVTRTRVDATTRAGLAAFGAAMAVSGSTSWCNPIDIAAEQQGAFEPTVTDGGGNHCACEDAAWPCKASSANLAPPLAL
ncbi:MAG: hypothetical protein RIF41_25800 [Polyangiaceae bacterium]